MEIISEELVAETWQEVAGFSPSRGRKEMDRVGERQPDLLTFMVAFTEDLDQEVKELALYMFFVVHRIFEKSSKKIKKISSKEVMKAYESNEKLLERLEGAHEKFIERIAGTQVAAQPFVMKYVVDTLMEMPEEKDPIELTQEDSGYLYLLFKTIIDLLNQAG